jgi:hypothetical protein
MNRSVANLNWGKREDTFYTAVRRVGYCAGLDVYERRNGDLVIYPVNSKGARGPVSIGIPADAIGDVVLLLERFGSREDG